MATHQLYKMNVHGKSYKPKMNMSDLPKHCVFPQQHLFTLRTTAFNTYMLESKKKRPYIPNLYHPHISGVTITDTADPQQDDVITNDINTYLIGHIPTIDNLITHAKIISNNNNNLIFYTDGAFVLSGRPRNQFLVQITLQQQPIWA